MPAGIKPIPSKRSPYQGFGPALASFVIGTEASNVIRVTATLKDARGNALAAPAAVKFYLSTDSGGANLTSSAPSGGIAVGTRGVVIENIADKSGILVTDSAGVANIDVTETSTPTFYLVLVLPDGTLAVSGAITFA